jgi:hypothetical protein
MKAAKTSRVAAVAIVTTLLLSLVAPRSGFTPLSQFAKAPSSVRGGDTSSASRTAMSATNAAVDKTVLIPREVLFGNPKYASPKLSPDGKYLSFLAPSPEENVLNVFVKRTMEDSLDDARMVTNDKSRGIRNAFWAEDSKTMLYLQDFEVRSRQNPTDRGEGAAFFKQVDLECLI